MVTVKDENQGNDVSYYPAQSFFTHEIQGRQHVSNNLIRQYELRAELFRKQLVKHKNLAAEERVLHRDVVHAVENQHAADLQIMGDRFKAHLQRLLAKKRKQRSDLEGQLRTQQARAQKLELENKELRCFAASQSDADQLKTTELEQMMRKFGKILPLGHFFCAEESDVLRLDTSSPETAWARWKMFVDQASEIQRLRDQLFDAERQLRREQQHTANISTTLTNMVHEARDHAWWQRNTAVYLWSMLQEQELQRLVSYSNMDPNLANTCSESSHTILAPGTTQNANYPGNGIGLDGTSNTAVLDTSVQNTKPRLATKRSASHLDQENIPPCSANTPLTDSHPPIQAETTIKSVQLSKRARRRRNRAQRSNDLPR